MTETATGYAGVLNINGAGTQAYGPDIKKLNLEIIFETADIARVKMTDATAARWEVPQSVVNRPHATSKPSTMNYKLTYTESPFSFELVRVSDGRSLFKLDSSSFIYKDQLLQISTTIDSSATTFGLGESTRTTQALADKTYTLWAIDQAALSMNTNLYGSFPYYLQMVNGAAHGAMLMNSNGMDVTLADTSLTFKPIGGIVDLYVFSGSTPAAVVDQYTQIVGRPTMMPYWSLGFHNCKYGYTSIQQVEQVVAGYAAAGIPLDTQWMDIDYMQNYKDFTLDSVNFPQAEVSSFVGQLHANGQHFVPIIDPGIMVQQGYDAYTEGVAKDLFVKDIQGNNYMAQVWPGPVHFPDFLHPSAQDYWTEQLKAFWNMAQPDGLWIDMNEVSDSRFRFRCFPILHLTPFCVLFLTCRSPTSAISTERARCAPTPPPPAARPRVPASLTAASSAPRSTRRAPWTSPRTTSTTPTSTSARRPCP
jgi:alpha-glucosidase (family GH31 glycosyl hydrolase)